MRLAADFHRESAYASHPLALAKVDELIVRAHTDSDRFCVVVADAVTDRMQGYLMAICHEHYFSYTKTVTDIGFYITEAYRSPAIARDMVRALERWAFHVKQASDISLGVSSGIADERIVRLYERLGYMRGFWGCIKSR
jgi:RimJ/RimL family protein N-acetyltransferase